MTLYNDIRGALQAQLAAVSGIPTISYEGIKFTPVQGTPFTRASFRPAVSFPSTMGDGSLVYHSGSFEVVLVYPTGDGTGTGETMADTVKASFKASTVLTLNGNNVRISRSERRPVFEDGNWYRVPISISWYTYSQEY